MSDDFEIMFLVDSRIMAKWKDGYYYPGVILKVDGTRYGLHFNKLKLLILKKWDTDKIVYTCIIILKYCFEI